MVGPTARNASAPAFAFAKFAANVVDETVAGRAGDAFAAPAPAPDSTSAAGTASSISNLNLIFNEYLPDR